MINSNSNSQRNRHKSRLRRLEHQRRRGHGSQRGVGHDSQCDSDNFCWRRRRRFGLTYHGGAQQTAKGQHEQDEY